MFHSYIKLAKCLLKSKTTTGRIDHFQICVQVATVPDVYLPNLNRWIASENKG